MKKWVLINFYGHSIVMSYYNSEEEARRAHEEAVNSDKEDNIAGPHEVTLAKIVETLKEQPK